MSKLFIIAESGINHNGDIEIAKQLIDMAKLNGCDAVKFQKRDINTVYDSKFLETPRKSPWGDTQRAQKEGLEFGKKEYDIIDAYCREKDIVWFASAWDVNSQKFLRQYDLKYNKVASAMITHYELLNMIAEEKKNTFISCGMSDWDMIDKAVKVFKEHECPFSLMHCVSTYPSDDKECNILAIKVFAEKYGCDVGYSGHEKGFLPSILAVAFGATILERHITIDRTMYGSDQAASLEKRGLELMVRDAKRTISILGDGQKLITSKEIPIAKKLRYYEE